MAYFSPIQKLGLASYLCRLMFNSFELPNGTPTIEKLLGMALVTI